MYVSDIFTLRGPLTSCLGPSAEAWDTIIVRHKWALETTGPARTLSQAHPWIKSGNEARWVATGAWEALRSWCLFTIWWLHNIKGYQFIRIVWTKYWIPNHRKAGVYWTNGAHLPRLLFGLCFINKHLHTDYFWLIYSHQHPFALGVSAI